jgi:hypothetical protein
MRLTDGFIGTPTQMQQQTKIVTLRPMLPDFSCSNPKDMDLPLPE